MTAAVAGAAARAAGGRAAASSATRSAARAPTRSGRAPRPNIDERSDRAAERFQAKYSKPGAGEKKAPRKRAPSSKGYMDAVEAGGEKEKTEPSAPASPSASPSLPTVNVNVPSPVSSGAGFVLALAFWTWIALPFLKNGPEGVRAMLKAKFTNKRLDGTYLP